MTKKFTFLLLFMAITFCTKTIAQTTYPTIYASLTSGGWGTTTTWETFAGNSTNTPGATGGRASATRVKTAIDVAALNKGNYTISITDCNNSNTSGFIKL